MLITAPRLLLPDCKCDGEQIPEAETKLAVPMGNVLTAKSDLYRNDPNYSDTPKFVVITLKFELCGSTIE